jgi:hypothetical protein
MATLPLNAAEPVTAVLGVMLYPADDEVAARDRWQALTLALFVSRLRAQGGDIPPHLLDWILTPTRSTRRTSLSAGPAGS